VTPLTRKVAAQIAERIRDTPAGTRLVERQLAEALRVSRSPVRGALRLLAEQGVLAPADGGGFETAAAPPAPPAEETDDAVYLRIAEDRLDGVLPERVTESALTRRYGIAPGRLGGVLRRIAAEGWIERLPGYGWEFAPVLTSMSAYRDSYRYRLAIEPAALLEPGYTVDRDRIAEVREQQQRLLDGEIRTVSATTLYDLNSRFHEVIAEGSGNAFFVDGLRRVNRLRRLIEYRRTLAPDRAVVRVREHVALADLLLAGDLRGASASMRRHLGTVAKEKTR
jgi:DNA-binding GntR family transcriptional regulator